MAKRVSDFHFKKFTIYQENATHKVGTDGVLLGAWVDIDNASNVLDIGTGTGLIALMLAQRTNETVHIDAIEINVSDVQQASINIDQSPWQKKIKLWHSDFKDFHTETKYDLIVSNPPFFINSTLPPEQARGHARHTHALSFEDLIQRSISFLNETGRLAVILPPVEADKFIHHSNDAGLHCIRKCDFYSRKHKPLERVIMEFSFTKQPIALSSLVLYENDAWSDEYCALTREFYLKI